MQFPRAISTYESTPLELQRFQILLNFHPTELHAKFWAQVTSTTANPPHAHGHHAFQRSPHRRSPLIPCVYNTDCPCLVHSSPSWPGLVLWTGCFEGCWLLLVVWFLENVARNFHRVCFAVSIKRWNINVVISKVERVGRELRAKLGDL